MSAKKELPVLTFHSQNRWRDWLSKNYDRSDGVLLRFYKKNSGQKSITYDEALDEALCFGWIDGQSKSLDEVSYLQKFTPRRKGSSWSKRNTEKTERLIAEGKMHPAGLAEIEKAKSGGRWEQAYDSPANAQIPEDFIEQLSKFPEAFTFFKTLNKTNLYSIAYRLQTAKKPETRLKRIITIIEMLKQGKKFH